MPFRIIPETDTRYGLICFDAEGEERRDDPDRSVGDGRMSSRLLETAVTEEVTNIFLFSHGWMGDVPAAVRQYDAWIGAFRWFVFGPEEGGRCVGMLGLVRLCSYWAMKKRVRSIGETGMHSFVNALQKATAARKTRIHLMGHSFGCVVVSSILGGPSGDGLSIVPSIRSFWRRVRFPFGPLLRRFRFRAQERDTSTE
jgi:hypothetical protein